METMKRTIAGVSFEIRRPFEAGHTLTEGEAKALNQVRGENISNNMRKHVEKAKEEGKSEADIQALVAEYDAEYELTLAAVASSRKLDPVEREAKAIARELLKEHLAKTGRKLTVPPEGETKETWGEKIEAQLEIIMAKDEVRKVAEKRVKDKQKTSEQLLASMEDVSA